MRVLGCTTASMWTRSGAYRCERPLIGALMAFFLAVAPGCKKSPKLSPASNGTGAPPAGATGAAPLAKRATGLALEHLPKDCDVVIAADAKRLLANRFVGDSLLLGAQPPKASASSPRSEHQEAFLAFLARSGIVPKEDLSQVAGCIVKRVGEGSRFLVSISGNLPPDVVPKLAATMPEPQKFARVQVQGREGLEREGRSLIQTSAGVVLFSNDRAMLAGALEPAQDYLRYRLAQGQDLTLVVGPAGTAQLSVQDTNPLAAALSGAVRFELGMQLEGGRAWGVAVLRDPSAATAAKAGFEAKLAQVIAEAQNAPNMMKRLIQPTVDVARAIKLTTEGPQLNLDLELPPGTFESLFQQFAMMASSGGLSGGSNGSPLSLGLGTASKEPTAPASPTALGGPFGEQAVSNAPSTAPNQGAPSSVPAGLSR